MITERELQEAIDECMRVKNPNANTCIKLASYYTILDHMEPKREREPVSYSYAKEESEFIKAISKLPESEAWEIMDDLMKALQVLNPRLYDGVMRKTAR